MELGTDTRLLGPEMLMREQKHWTERGVGQPWKSSRDRWSGSSGTKCGYSLTCDSRDCHQAMPSWNINLMFSWHLPFHIQIFFVLYLGFCTISSITFLPHPHLKATPLSLCANAFPPFEIFPLGHFLSWFSKRKIQLKKINNSSCCSGNRWAREMHSI